MPQSPPNPLPSDSNSPYVLVPLHEYPEFVSPCATLLNMEWPRSHQARLHSLYSCSKNFPLALVLVQCDVRQVVGFCKVSLIPNAKHACFVESVLVHPDLRRKGLGSLLMRKLEDYVISCKLSILYLSTLGQENFYKKLGYQECEPVSLYSFGLGSYTKREKADLHDAPIKANGHDSSNGNKPLNKSNAVSKFKTDMPVGEQRCAPPPAPPPLPSLPIGMGVMIMKTYMKKEVSSS